MLTLRKIASRAKPGGARINPFRPPAYEPETQFLIARFTSPPDDTRIGHIDDVFVALKVAGLLTVGKLDGLAFRAAHDSQAARVNWLLPITATAVNGPTFTVDRGFAGDAASSYLDNNVNLSTAGGNFSQNSAYLGLYTNVGISPSTAKFAAGTFSSAIKAYRASNSAGARINTSGGAERFFTVAGGTGWTSWGRSASGSAAGTDFYVAKDGAVVASTGNVSPSAALTNANLLELCATNNGGTPSGYSDDRVAAIAWGGYLTPAEDAILRNIVVTYLTAVGGN